MLKKLIVILFVLGTIMVNNTYAEEQTDINDPLYRGLEIYIKTHEADAAIKEWIKGSALEGDKKIQSQANIMKQLEDMIGKPVSYDILSQKTLSPRSQLDTVALNHEKGICYHQTLKYKKPSGEWIIQEFSFYTSPQAFFSSEMLFDK